VKGCLGEEKARSETEVLHNTDAKIATDENCEGPRASKAQSAMVRYVSWPIRRESVSVEGFLALAGLPDRSEWWQCVYGVGPKFESIEGERFYLSLAESFRTILVDWKGSVCANSTSMRPVSNLCCSVRACCTTFSLQLSRGDGLQHC
jgi:hypothetical protein